jgi:dTDP-4-amino-4,6-dideoxygalactose transaminase
VLRSLRGHGTGAVKYEHVRLGVNSRLDTFQAAVLLVKLTVFKDELISRQKAAEGYSQRLSSYVTVPHIPAGYKSSWAQYTIRVAKEKRAPLIKHLKEQSIPANIYYPLGLHSQPAFSSLAEGDCPETEKACREVLSLPMHPYLDEATLDRISQAVIRGLELGA